ncbi:FUSC family protein [Mycolicibacterium sp.]|uniref:FUSC family protein n=1 Tax=Mycolicibacterium sp. TaxID=2320850 RepID=UPI0028AB6800|nr:FUSC family protein [Mycolicibacterium sp.]
MPPNVFRSGAFRKRADSLRTRDPGHDGLRRAARAAIVIPLAAIVGFLVAGPTQAPVFTLVGAMALMVVADFPGSVGTRAMAYAGLGINGFILIALGTWAAPHPWIAVPLCFVVGTLVSVLGLLSEMIAAGQRATLMVFLLPVCAPAGPLSERLLGWLLALAVCVPGALFLFPPRLTNDLRHVAAQVCIALADRLDGGRASEDSTADQLSVAMTALNDEFRGTAFRPVALTAGSRSLIRLVSNLRWLGNRVGPDSGALLGPIEPASVALLRGSAEVLESADRAGAQKLAALVTEHRRAAFRQYGNDIHEILAEPDDDAAVARGRALLSRRTMSATIGLTGSIIAAATITDTRSPVDKLLGRGVPETGVADRVHTKRSAVVGLVGYLSTRSVTVLNSLRTGLALAMAVVVTLVLPVENGLWVALGALSVLRSSAATTRTSVVSALTGTVIGFIAGSGIIAVVGVHPITLFCLLPLATFGSTYVLKVGSFTASQAMFTMQVLIVFNMMRPTGWQIGLIRIEDVVLGGAVGLVVSALMWPGGASTAVRRAIDNAVLACSWYLDAAVTRVTRGVSPDTDAAVAELGSEALIAARTHGDAVRVYLAETNGTIDIAQVESAERIPRLRTAADLIADVVPPPAGSFPLTRNVLEQYTAALCACIEQVNTPASLPEISDEFIPALRAEAIFTADAAQAALPLVTVAATIGELQLTYPAPSADAEAVSA